eukprot:3124832-Ditylum_brightwellii.AAC.1
MRNFCVGVAVSRTIWVSASVLSRMYFVSAEHSQSWVVSTPVSPLPPRMRCLPPHVHALSLFIKGNLTTHNGNYILIIIIIIIICFPIIQQDDQKQGGEI